MDENRAIASRRVATLQCARGMRRYRAAAALLALGSTGCRRAPDYSILGSFFPVWLFCGAFGILLAFLVHLLLLRLEWNEQLAPPLLVYPGLAVLFSLGLWLALYS